ncbi:MAG: histidine phosphatase family protein [Kiritimatiellae bacterium]|nr:histidine phosphatase family protein [Kiritimatiellia bacterium]
MPSLPPTDLHIINEDGQVSGSKKRKEELRLDYFLAAAHAVGRHADSLPAFIRTYHESEDRKDAPLTALGEDQARTLAGVFDGQCFDSAHVSPLRRARRTFALASVTVRRAPYDTRLIEIDWEPGFYEGFAPGELPDIAEPDRHDAWSVPAWERASAFLEEVLASDDELILAVTHQGICRHLAGVFMGLERPKAPLPMWMDNASASMLDVYADGRRLIRRWNDTRHVAHLLSKHSGP